MAIISNISKAEDLETTHEQTRKGFIEAAMEKNRRAQPFIESARTLRNAAQQARTPYDLLNMPEIRKPLLTASGLSDKAANYFDDEDKTAAIKELIERFLVPAKDGFVDELIYRYLLISGDSLGGKMRNIVGAVAQMKLLRKLLSVLDMQQIAHQIMFKEDKKKKYSFRTTDYATAYERALDISAITWEYNGVKKVLFFNSKITLVDNNVDICLYDCSNVPFNSKMAKEHPECAIMFGELKGGIDPAGADEHWKTGNSALERIRDSFIPRGYRIHTSFVAAAIEKKMAREIFSQLRNETLSFAINLTYDNQLCDYCNWLIRLEKKQ